LNLIREYKIIILEPCALNAEFNLKNSNEREDRGLKAGPKTR